MHAHRPLPTPRRPRLAEALRAVARVLALIAVCVTCDASTALRPPDVRPVTLSWATDTVLVVGGRLASEVTATVDGEPYPSPRLRFSSSDSTIVGFAPDGRTLVGRRLGRATITVQLLSTTMPSPPVVSREVFVSPAGVQLTGRVDTLYSIGDTTRLRATAVDANGQPVAVEGVRWSSSDTAVLIVDALGLVTARRNGDATIRAEIGAQVDTARMHVWQRPARLQPSIPQVTLDALGADTTLSVVPLDARGGTIDRAPAPSITWSTRDASIATVADGRVVAVANGITWVRVASAGVQDSIRVEVAQRATRVVVETPGPVHLQAVGESIEARARGYDRRGNELAHALPSWRSLNPLVAHVEARTGLVLVTGLAKGEATLVAEQDGVSATLLVTVSNVPAQVVLEPAIATLTSVGDTLALHWTVRNSRGVVIPDTTVALATTDAAILQVIPGGRVVAVATGAARIIATAGAAADTAFITVINAVENVSILIDVATLASVGDTLVPPVDIRSARGVVLSRTAATWTSDDPGVARVTAGGIVIAMGAGETVVRATSPTYADRRDSVRVTVTNAPASVRIDREADTLVAIGAARTYSAEVRNARFALLSVTPSWRSLDPGIARVSATGLATGVGLGTARVVATAGAAADTLLLTVRDDVASLELTPATVTLSSIGDVLRPTVLARNAIGTVVIEPVLTWQSSDESVARLQANAEVLAVGAGTARIIATAGRVADTVVVTVTNLPALVDIEQVRDSIDAIGDSSQLTLIVRNSRGDLLPSSTVTWSVDDPVVARVGPTGMVTARAVGSTWVRAAGGTARDSALVIVTNEVAALTLTHAVSGAPATLDTLTSAGQSLAYAAVATNGVGAPIPNVTVVWRSTAPAILNVTATGVATAYGPGSALVIARAGDAEDTTRVVIIDPTRIYVDNSVIVPVRFGTIARPYATIQDGVNAAGTDDTVIVRRGNGYSESVMLGRRLTLLGDSSDYVAGGRNPALLPRIGHDLGAAGIASGTAGASYTIRYLAIQHTVDGDAVAIRDADNVLLDNVHVNPMPGFRTGRGLLVERATGSVLIARARVDSVFAYGVRVVDATNVRVDDMTVRAVGARSGFAGAGIEAIGGTNIVVTGAVVRRSAGPQVLLDRTANASLLASTLVGEQQLVRLIEVTGTTVVRGNTFDMRYQAGELTPSRSSNVPDPSALEILRSAGVAVDANTFTDVGGQSSLMDGVRLADVRVGSTGAPYAALLTANRFGGGRHAVRSTRSTWTMSGSRVDSASVGVLLADADSVTLSADTVASARSMAVQSAAPAANLSITNSLFTGAQRAMVVSNAARVSLRRSTITGATGSGTPQPALGSVDLSAASVDVVDNTLTNVRGWAALMVRDGVARVDSNFVSRNLVGVRAGVGAAATLGMRHNSLFDNDTLAASARRVSRGFVNDGPAATLSVNWWGDPRGPSLDRVNPPDTYGDSAVGLGSFPFTTAPLGTHVGSGATGELRKLGGDGQTGPTGRYLGKVFAVRVVDGQGRPLPNVVVTFRTSRNAGDFYNGSRSGNDILVTSTSDANGFAWAALTTGTTTGTYTITAVTGAFTITFTATVQ